MLHRQRVHGVFYLLDLVAHAVVDGALGLFVDLRGGVNALEPSADMIF